MVLCKRKPTCVAAVALAALLSTADAQSAGTGAYAFVSGGASVANVGGVNSSLRGAGRATLPQRYWAAGGGCRVVKGRSVFEVERVAIPGRSETAEAYETSMSGSLFSAKLGYSALSGRRYAVYPIVGVGLGTATLRVSPLDAAAFPELLSDPGRMTALDGEHVCLSIAMGAQRVVSARALSDSLRAEYLIGVRIGYMHSYAMGDWKLAGNSVARPADVFHRGPYVRVTVAGGLRRAK